MFRKLICLLLALALAAAPLFGGAGTVRAASVSADEMEALIEKQIRAFADSIDKSGADDAAAAALAKHGLSGGGKTLKVGKTHGLTATIFNSEMWQSGLIRGCTAAIRSMQQLDLSVLPYISGTMGYYGAGSDCYLYVFHSDEYGFENWDWQLFFDSKYTGKRNAYDDSLEWIGGSITPYLKIERTKTTATEQTYKVTCTAKDRFDFSTSSSDGFQNLISGFGAVLFREFTWESTVTFNLTVPYTCNHQSGVYHWTYDPKNKTMTSEGADGFTQNDATFIHQIEESGIQSRYFELDETVRLYHDKPWVIEYDVKKPGSFAFSPLCNHTITSSVCLKHYNQKGLFATYTDHVQLPKEVMNQYQLKADTNYIDYYCGTPIDKLFPYSTAATYTYRLENKISSNGSNMIYMTVSDTETGEILAENIPLDDYYYYERWIKEYKLVSNSSTRLSGEDLFINYLGRQRSSFSAEYFDLRIWENGEDGQSESYCKTKVTKPTCTAQGYTTYTCACCGYSYKADKVKAKGHSFGDWTVVSAATCTENGEEQRKCKNCDHSESRTVDATGHNYENYVCTNCGERKYVPGDVDLNETVDVDDVLALLWNVLFPEDYPVEAYADFDGNGTTDVDDVLTLLWHVLFPEEYPLT